MNNDEVKTYMRVLRTALSTLSSGSACAAASTSSAAAAMVATTLAENVTLSNG
jgi:hypothetical protein